MSMVSNLGENFRCPRRLCQSIFKRGSSFLHYSCFILLTHNHWDWKWSQEFRWWLKYEAAYIIFLLTDSFKFLNCDCLLMPLQETLSLKGRMHGDTFLSDINLKIYCMSDVNYLHHNFTAISNKRMKICLRYRKH